MKNPDTYPLLVLLKKTERRCSGFFKKSDQLRASKSSPDEFTVNDTFALTCDYTFKSNLEQFHYGELAYILDEWRITKQVYTFSNELIEMFLRSDDFKIPFDLLNYLPYTCFYAELDGDEEYHGILVKYISSGPDRGLMMMSLSKKGKPWVYLYNINNDITNEIFRDQIKFYTDGLNEEQYCKIRKLILLSLQCALYLCAKNCDISENPEQQKIHRPMKERIRDKYSEIRKWDVGYRIVKNQEKALSASTDRDTVTETAASDALTRKKKRQRPRQHWRKAHWHTYLVGKGRKKRELKFISATLVNDIKDTLPVVNHK